MKHSNSYKGNNHGLFHINVNYDEAFSASMFFIKCTTVMKTTRLTAFQKHSLKFLTQLVLANVHQFFCRLYLCSTTSLDVWVHFSSWKTKRKIKSFHALLCLSITRFYLFYLKYMGCAYHLFLQFQLGGILQNMSKNQ